MDVIKKYFPNLNSWQIDAFRQLGDLYIEWNQKINVISRKDIDHLYTKHILHSLAIAKIINFLPGTKILDVGTGGGFPGIPLAILFRDSNFHLIDAIGKKITVVNSISEQIGLKNVKGEQSRVENVKSKYDFIVSRAVTRFDRFRAITRKNISAESKNKLKNGIIYLKGGDFQDELEGVRHKTHIYKISTFFDDPFFETKKIIHTALW